MQGSNGTTDRTTKRALFPFQWPYTTTPSFPRPLGAIFAFVYVIHRVEISGNKERECDQF